MICIAYNAVSDKIFTLLGKKGVPVVVVEGRFIHVKRFMLTREP